jgi:hypothetical protein
MARTTKKTPVTNEEIHAEMKKLHLSIQVLMNVVTKLHEDTKHIHSHLSEDDKPKKRWFGLAHGKQSWWS